MSPDELRALAEALDKITPVMGLEELHHMETLDRAADFLRQCAEQRPVAWMSDESAGRLLGGGNGSRGTVPVHCERSRVSAIPLYLHPAPAAPQPADRCRSSETPSSKATSAASPERQALNLEDAAAQVAAGSGEQAEPPRQAGHEISLGALMREQRQSRIVAGAYPDGNPNAGAMMAQTPQAGPQREPLRDALKTVIYELAALIPNPDKTLVDDWPCENAADRQCLQIAYTTARSVLHGIGGSDAE